MSENEPTYISVLADLEYIRDGWPVLVSMKIPGSRRQWVETPRKQRLSLSDLDRMGRKGVPRQSPADVGVLDLLATIATTAEDVAWRVVRSAELAQEYLFEASMSGQPWAWTDPHSVQAAVNWVVLDKWIPTRPASVNPGPWLNVTRMWLAEADNRDPEIVARVGRPVASIAGHMAKLLGDVRDGQAMNGVCRWCRGADNRGQIGWYTIRLEHPNPDDATSEPLMVCYGHDCRPPGDACGIRHRGRPAWAQREWPWLASQMLTREELVPTEPVDDWATPALREAHQRYKQGDRAPLVCAGELEYDRLRKQRSRIESKQEVTA